MATSVDFSWDVSQGSGVGGSGAGAGSSSSSKAVSNTLGSALVRPFRRTERADFNNGFGVPEVLSCIGQVLGTRIGTLPWRPDFGCDIDRLRHKTKTPTVSDVARVMIEDALRRWEPRCQLTSVSSIQELPNEIVLRVTVRIGNKTQTINVAV